MRLLCHILNGAINTLGQKQFPKGNDSNLDQPRELLCRPCEGHILREVRDLDSKLHVNYLQNSPSYIRRIQPY